ncbi:MAG: metal-dependent hydrolase [Planctomycetales bacterium]|nr:metal-dependent hydrolase [Planctomycetales bacterium]
MAGFKTHIATSTVVGLGYGSAMYALFDVPIETCLVSSGLCSVAGILPDIDSESGQTVREITGFAAAVVPLLLLDQLRAYGVNHDEIILAGGSLYIIMRFGLASLINRITVHRGMWHSIPAALAVGLAASWLCDCPVPFLRFMKVIAVVLGFMTHLVLDEIYSFEFSRGRPRIKKSLGTALKFWNPNSLVSNMVAYGALIALSVFAWNDPMLRGGPESPIHTFAREAVDEVLGENDQVNSPSSETFPASTRRNERRRIGH